MLCKRTAILITLMILFLMGRALVRADRVDDYVRDQMGKWHIPGMSVAVVRDGNVVLARGYGLANVELSVPATKDTVYELLSVSKQFTATAILMLVKEGKLGLDEKVATYLPDTPPAWGGVTVRHLLTHTSGIPDYTDIPPFFENIRLDATPEALLKPVRERPLNFAPGTQWRYSNSNYYELGLLIEKISGVKYADFLNARIFQPLGMTATRMNDMTDIIPNRAAGYHWIDEEAKRIPAFISGYHGRTNVLQNAIYVSPTRKWAAGAIVSTVMDLAKWDVALYTETLLPTSLLAQMWTPARLQSGAETGYGFGNELETDHGHRVAGHQGGGMAFNATLLRYVDDKLTVIVLTNLTQAPSRPIARHLAAFYLPGLSDAQNKGIADREPQITRMLKGVLLDAAQGTVDATLFTAEAQASLVPFVKREGPQFLGPLGPLQSFTLLERREENKRRLYRYRAVFGKTSLLWRFELTTEGKIARMEPTQE